MMDGSQRISHDTAEVLDPLDFISKGFFHFSQTRDQSSSAAEACRGLVAQYSWMNLGATAPVS